MGRDAQPPRKGLYILDGVLRACQLLQAFEVEGEDLRLQDLVDRTGLKKTTAFRVLHSLQAGGLVERVGRHRYRATIQPVKPKRFRLGYAGQGSEFPFAQEVNDSIRRHAADHEIDFVEFDNHYSPTIALRNAAALVRQQIHLAVEFQTHEAIAPEISSIFSAAKVPLIAIDVPHPGATYYGANNYVAGLIAGRALGQWAARHWEGHVDEVILMELPLAGAVPDGRLRGVETGLQETVPRCSSARVVRLNSEGRLGVSLRAVRRHLRFSSASRTLIGAINDPSALGALRAFEEAGRLAHCAVVGHGASHEGRAELRRPHTRLIGSIGFFPERYGEQLIRLALDILQKKPVPRAVFIKHRLITPEKVDHYYPNDALLHNVTDM